MLVVKFIGKIIGRILFGLFIVCASLGDFVLIVFKGKKQFAMIRFLSSAKYLGILTLVTEFLAKYSNDLYSQYQPTGPLGKEIAKIKEEQSVKITNHLFERAKAINKEIREQ